MPFLIIICLGLIVVLGVRLWKTLYGGEANQSAYMHIVSGSAQMKSWGTEQFFDISSDVVIIEGDEIKTSADGKVILEFFDGTIMRISGGSYLVLSEINESDDPSISIWLIDGKLWVNKIYGNSRDTNIAVNLDAVSIKSDELSAFEVEHEFDELVRVIRGDEVLADINSKGDKSKVVESETIGVGQEMVFTDEVLEKYWQYQSPSILAAISDEFKASDWFKWNDAEDASPTQIDKSLVLSGETLVEVESEIMVPEVEIEASDPEADTDESVETPEEEPEEEPEVPDEETPEEEPAADLGPLTVPTITSVGGVTETNSDGYYVVDGATGIVPFAGTVSGASKVVVYGYTLSILHS